LFELVVAAFQVVANLVRLHFMPIEDLAHRTLDQIGETLMSCRWPMLARVAGQQSLALRQASDTNQALASAVIVGSLPGRGRSSSAANGP
jgi:hypothetical protein